MLPKAAKVAKEKQSQTLLDGHLKEIPKSEPVKPYSDSIFQEAAVEWLIATDQVRNPHFYQNPHLTMGSISPSRLLSTQNSVIWSISHHVRQMVLLSPVARWLVKRLSICLRGGWIIWRLIWRCKNVFKQISLPLTYSNRVTRFAVILAWHVTHGKLRTRMAILLSPVIGLKSHVLASGRLKVQC